MEKSTAGSSDTSAAAGSAAPSAAPSPAPTAASAGTVSIAGVQTARVGYGAMQLEKLRGDRAAALALLGRALELGVNHFDTAEFYGAGFVNGLLSEGVIAPGGRDSGGLVIATKVGAATNAEGPLPLRPAQKPNELREAVEANLRTLGTERLDLVYLRRLEVGPGITAEGDQLVDIDDQLAVLTDLRTEGLIGAIGLSAVTLETVARALPASIAAVQNVYSLVQRGFDDLAALCAAHGVAWVPFFPLGDGRGGPMVRDLAPVIAAADELGVTASQVGLAWLLQRTPTTTVIPGTTGIRHLEENVAAGAVTLPPEVVAALDVAATAATGHVDRIV